MVISPVNPYDKLIVNMGSPTVTHHRRKYGFSPVKAIPAINGEKRGFSLLIDMFPPLYPSLIDRYAK